MNLDKFRKLIETIGFEYVTCNDYITMYRYDKFIIYSMNQEYRFCDGDRWVKYDYDNFEVINKYFKKEIRSIKLKKLL